MTESRRGTHVPLHNRPSSSMAAVSAEGGTQRMMFVKMPTLAVSAV